MYLHEPLVTVDPGPVGRLLEGSSRPGFFGGVLTVVLKLFQLAAPDVAVFGEKDAQQLALVRRMTADLDLGVEIAAVAVGPDPGGVAGSTRDGDPSGEGRSAGLAPAPAAASGDGHHGAALLLVAARAGATRLIDNTQVMLPGQH